jgi:medium-chain acyl-[acyl-carrier-protein] hydrolase
MIQIPDTWTEQRHIESFDVDITGRLRPQTLLSYLLNAAWSHASNTTYSYDELSKRNLFWVLFKVQLFIKRLPDWDEQITIETWGKRVERLYALRDFQVTSQSGEKLVSATSSWMILDRNSNRPLRLDQNDHSFPWQPGRDELQTNLDKLPEAKNAKLLSSFQVHFSDIDVNHHVNATRYLQWAIDAHPFHIMKTRPYRSIEINYLMQAMPDDTVEVFSEETEKGELCFVRRAKDGKDLCRAMFEWGQPEL